MRQVNRNFIFSKFQIPFLKSFADISYSDMNRDNLCTPFNSNFYHNTVHESVTLHYSIFDVKCNKKCQM